MSATADLPFFTQPVWKWLLPAPRILTVQELADDAWEWWRSCDYGWAFIADAGWAGHRPAWWAFYWLCEPQVMRSLPRLSWRERRGLSWLLPAGELALAVLR